MDAQQTHGKMPNAIRIRYLVKDFHLAVCGGAGICISTRFPGDEWTVHLEHISAPLKQGLPDPLSIVGFLHPFFPSH